MTGSFLPLLSLGVTHAYHGGPTRDIGFLVPQDTARVLRGARALVREREGVLHVLYEAAEGGAPRGSLAGRALRVGLVLRSACFHNVTALDPGLAGLTPLYANGATFDALDAPRGVRLVGRRARVRVDLPARPVTIQLEDRLGQVVYSSDPIQDGRTEIALDLDVLEPGPHLARVSGDGDERTEALYLDPELLAAGAFGVVEIGIRAEHYAAPRAYTIPFAARTGTLRYYVVARNLSDAEFAALAVTDRGAADDGRPAILFQRVEAGSFGGEEIAPALLTSGEDRVVLFRSTAPVPRSAKTRTRIALSRNGDELIKNLPQPGPEKTTTDMIVHVGKP